MLSLDRTRPPALAALQQPPFPKPGQGLLRNGLPYHILVGSPEPVVELQLVLEGGTLHEAMPGVGGAALRMLQEGTARHTAQGFAQALDALGASLSFSAGNHTSVLRLTVLERNLPPALDLVQDLLLWPAFPDEAWARLHTQLQQQAAQQEAKTQYHAQRLFFPAVFGSHGYGSIETAASVAALRLDDLKAYWATVVRPLNGFLILAGGFDEDRLVALLEQKVGLLQRPAHAQTNEPTAPPSHPAATYHHPMANTVQATLLVGHGGPPRSHPDYYPLKLLATALGGYFGSRLMQHLREEKGYTYGIGGGFTSYRLGGYFGVRTDVGTAYLEPAIAAIRHEIERIRTEPLLADELERARRYLLGRFIAGQETPFQRAAILKSLLVHGVPLQAYQQGFAQLRALTADDVQALAQRHLRPEVLVVASAGGVAPA